MKLGVLTASISRQAGGLHWAIRSLVRSIQDAGCELQVFAGADEYSLQDREKWGDIRLTILPTRGPAAFGYQVGLSPALAKVKLDIAHVHGLWMYPSAVTKKLRKQDIPYLISPHGMLDPWAVRNAKWKKRLAGLLYENAHLRGAACIHALSDVEYESIRAFGLNNPVAVIPNGVELPDLNTTLPTPGWATSLPADSKVLLYLSRLHPKKGLVNLLHAWAQRKKLLSYDTPWHLIIAGWEQGGHQSELEHLATELNIETTVHFVGPQFGQDKAASYKCADAFILPSFSEGLPMAVLEAWSYGLPVLMTPQCNIPEGFTHQAALYIEPTVAGIAAGINQMLILDAQQLELIGANGLALVEKKFNWDIVACGMLAVYRWILGQGEPPSCVRFD